MPFKLDPIKRCAFFMILFTGGAVVAQFSSASMLHLAMTLGWGLTLYAFYSWTTNKRKNVWDTVITSLIICLLLHDAMGLTELIYPLIATSIAITQKFFVEYKNSPIVNPAVTGLLLTALLLAFIPGLDKPFVSWWGASYQGYVSLGLMALWIVGGLHQWKKWHTVLSFFGVYLLGLFFREGWESVQFTLTDSTLYFFATIMLVEPKTSPFKPGEQMAYGIFAALLLLGLEYGEAPYPELFTLVGANLAFLGMRFRPKPMAPAKLA